MTLTSELPDGGFEAAAARTVTRNRKFSKETETTASCTCGTIAKGRTLMSSDHQKETDGGGWGGSIQRGNG